MMSVSHLQLQQLCLPVVFGRRPGGRPQQAVDGGQGQGRSVQRVKQTPVQRETGAVLGGRLRTRRFVNVSTKSRPVFPQRVFREVVCCDIHL